MAMPRDPDETMPATGSQRPADATMPVTQPGGGPGGSGPGGGPGGGGWDDGEEEGDRRRLWFIAGGVLAVGILVGAVVAVVAAGGGDSTSGSTSTSSSTSTSTSTSTSSTTSTTQGPNPQILQFSASPNPVTCGGPPIVNLNLTWSTQNTSGVTISIDGSAYGSYQPTGNQTVPFSCPAAQHTYLLTANGTNGQTATKQLVVHGNLPPPPTTTTTT